jgi:hypothetical protein
MGASALPVWAVALLLAVVAPFVARAVAEISERRVRARTLRLFGELRGTNDKNDTKDTRDTRDTDDRRGASGSNARAARPSPSET